MERPTNYRAFTISYVPATDTRSSRVSITDNRFNQKKVINYSHEFNSIGDIAQDYLESIGIEIIGAAELLNHKHMLFTRNFSISIKGGEV